MSGGTGGESYAVCPECLLHRLFQDNSFSPFLPEQDFFPLLQEYALAIASCSPPHPLGWIMSHLFTPQVTLEGHSFEDVFVLLGPSKEKVNQNKEMISVKLYFLIMRLK